ncbi:MAG: hypothetical protein D6692_01090, partial [Planctomycetota bacterium]
CAPPGAVVFHRFLEQLNREHAIQPGEPAAHGHKPRPWPTDTFERTNADIQPAAKSPDLPTLAEVLPVSHPPAARPVTEVVMQQRTSISGRLIDLLA